MKYHRHYCVTKNGKHVSDVITPTPALNTVALRGSRINRPKKKLAACWRTSLTLTQNHRKHIGFLTFATDITWFKRDKKTLTATLGFFRNVQIRCACQWIWSSQQNTLNTQDFPYICNRIHSPDELNMGVSFGKMQILKPIAFLQHRTNCLRAYMHTWCQVQQQEATLESNSSLLGQLAEISRAVGILKWLNHGKEGHKKRVKCALIHVIYMFEYTCDHMSRDDTMMIWIVWFLLLVCSHRDHRNMPYVDSGPLDQ